VGKAHQTLSGRNFNHGFYSAPAQTLPPIPSLCFILILYILYRSFFAKDLH